MHNTCMGATAPGLAAPDAAVNARSREPASPAAGAGGKPELSRSDEAHGTPHAAGPKDQQTHLDFASDDAAGKAFATLRAQLALADYSLHRSEAEDGPRNYFVTRWGMVRELRNLPAVSKFVESVGVRCG